MMSSWSGELEMEFLPGEEGSKKAVGGRSKLLNSSGKQLTSKTPKSFL